MKRRKFPTHRERRNSSEHPIQLGIHKCKMSPCARDKIAQNAETIRVLLAAEMSSLETS